MWITQENDKIDAENLSTYTAYEFAGWYKDSGLTEKAEDISLSDGDITLYGEWRKTTKNVEYVRVNINNTLDEEGGYILFGQYPQTIKAADVTIKGDTPDENGYYLGSDGAKYVKAVADPNGGGYTFSDDTAVTSGSAYYFKVESIRWRILSESNGKALIVCDSIIANHCFNGKTTVTENGTTNYGSNYKDSDIRTWLNGEFYNAAFGTAQQAVIQTTKVDNSVESTGYTDDKFACADTEDKIFLLSYAQAANAEYGFSEDKEGCAARERSVSDYSRATGASVYPNGSGGNWWLRSPAGAVSDSAQCVQYNGSIANKSVVFAGNGVVPALNLTL